MLGHETSPHYNHKTKTTTIKKNVIFLPILTHLETVHP